MIKRSIVGIFALTFAGYAAAGTTTYTTQTWNFGSSSSSANVSGNEVNLTEGTIGVTATAWSSSGNPSYGHQSSCGTGPECNSGNVAYDQDPFIERATLTQYNGSGLGAINLDEGDSSPHHAVDNKGSNTGWIDYDMVLFEFDTAVELTGVRAGWTSNDSDVSILGYTGTGSLGSTPFSSSTKWSDLMSDGWGYQTDKFNIGTNTANISPGFESKYWLVGVYNSVFSGNAGDSNWDSVKIKKLYTRKGDSQTQVPEPATFALLLAGMVAVFRRKLSA
ncbi:exosortase-dependent surface protein XDP1 [Aliiglaciecola lipolytica]|uniref:Ice-binding protein C-terminal domain-containing protein n=1 Tax=Aliiglaciecola lipolytica E3 TaxID=1127673 RepID=K6X5J5_9ALTE|nr:exosortase-dependent surface protein XDP1 [Aliiglaciecola lipolytica]GAC15879.1 hypothetical protein GLIP_3265 [Aliiglaciecola lipolytica E3]